MFVFSMSLLISDIIGLMKLFPCYSKACCLTITWTQLKYLTLSYRIAHQCVVEDLNNLITIHVVPMFLVTDSSV